jgi:hypothetical protein
MNRLNYCRLRPPSYVHFLIDVDSASQQRIRDQIPVLGRRGKKEGGVPVLRSFDQLEEGPEGGYHKGDAGLLGISQLELRSLRLIDHKDVLHDHFSFLSHLLSLGESPLKSILVFVHKL